MTVARATSARRDRPGSAVGPVRRRLPAVRAARLRHRHRRRPTCSSRPPVARRRRLRGVARAGRRHPRGEHRLPRRRRRLGARQPGQRAVRGAGALGRPRPAASRRQPDRRAVRASCWPPTRGSGSRPPRSATSCGRSVCCWPARWPPAATAGWWPGVLFGLAIGCRLSTVFLVWPGCVAERLGRRGRRGRRGGARSLTGAVALAVGVALLRPVVAVGGPHARLPRQHDRLRRASASTSVGGR